MNKELFEELADITNPNVIDLEISKDLLDEAIDLFIEIQSDIVDLTKDFPEIANIYDKINNFLKINDEVNDLQLGKLNFEDDENIKEEE